MVEDVEKASQKTVSQKSRKSSSTSNLKTVKLNDYSYNYEKNNHKKLHELYKNFSSGKLTAGDFKKSMENAGYVIKSLNASLNVFEFLW